MNEPITGPYEPRDDPQHIPDSTALPGTVSDWGTVTPSVAGASSTTVSAASGDGLVRYQIRHFHARGGLGEVFVGHDRELNREVALKRIRAEHAARPSSQRRFLVEAEITARLQHPGIVPVYGLVQDAQGQPCYAMRYIEGEPFSEAIKRFHAGPHGFDSLEFRELLQRFVAVCHTIAYAHSRGVIHRDIKPANVMLGAYGETLVVDWGLAKQVGARSVSEGGLPLDVPATVTEEAGTQMGSAIGTPAFMSPEQAAGLWDIVGPASDICSLGATLYNLLSGRAPFEGPDVAHVLAAAQQGLCVPPREVNRAIPAPLEAVCLKAMSKEITARYASATELAKDVDRWLADEAVEAHREPSLVRVRRWMRRHRPMVTGATAALFVVTISLVVGTTLLAFANENLREANQRESAERERVTLINGFFRDNLLAVSRPKGQVGGLGREVTMKAALDQAAARIDTAFASQPLIEAEVRNTIGMTYTFLSNYNEALPHYERALELRRLVLGTDHNETLDSQNNLAHLLKALGRLNETERLYRETLNSRLRTLGPDHATTLLSQNSLASLLLAQGKLDDAVDLHRKTFETQQRLLGSDHIDTVKSLQNLAVVLLEQGKLTEAEPVFRLALDAMHRIFPPEHPDTLAVQNNMSMLLKGLGKLTEAESLSRKTLEQQRIALGADHDDTLRCQHNLAALLIQQGKLAEAKPILRRTVEAKERVFGADHAETLASKHHLAGLLRAEDNLAEAESLYRVVLQGKRLVLPADHPDLATTLAHLGSVLTVRGKAPEAEPHLREALGIRQRSLPRGAGPTAYTEGLLGECLSAMQHYADSEPLLVSSYESLREAQGVPPQVTEKALVRLVYLYDAWNKPAEADKWRAKLPPAARLQDGLQRHSAWPLFWGWPRF